MKIRAGFVSNSSSSSFVAVGVKIPNIMADGLSWDVLDEMDLRLFDCSENGWHDGRDDCVIGKVVADGDYEYLNHAQLELTELQQISIEVEEKAGVKGIPILIAGTMLT